MKLKAYKDEVMLEKEKGGKKVTNQYKKKKK